MAEGEHLRKARERTSKALAPPNGRPKAEADPWPEERRGDAWEGPAPSASGKAQRHAAPEPKADPPASYQPFPLDALPEPLRGYVDAGARAVGVDPSFVALPLLVAMAGAIGNSRRISIKRSWEEPAILWAAIVGESGTQKSPAIDMAKRFPRRRQHLSLRRHEVAMEEYATKLENLERGQAKPGPPKCERYLVDDATVESLAPILRDNWRGVTVVKDELAGWIGGFDKYSKGKQSGDAAKWLEMHGGRSIVIDRKGGNPPTIYVPRAALNVVGGIQPGILRRAIGQEYRDNGLLARLLLAWPRRRAKTWSEADVDSSLIDAVQQVYDRLFELTPETDEDAEPAPKLVSMTTEAKALFVQFVNQHGQEQVSLDGELSAAWSKIEGYAARLALVHYLVRWAANEVQDEALLDAISITAGIDLARWFASEARRVYAGLEESQEDANRRELVELIQRKCGRITVRDLMNSSRRKYQTADDAELALAGLVKAGAGAWESQSPDPRGGRPSRVFRLL